MQLTFREFTVLKTIETLGRFATDEEVAKKVWPGKKTGRQMANIYIHRLRKKGLISVTGNKREIIVL